MDDIRKLRTAQGLSQDALSRRLGVDVSTVSYWETGRSFPRASIVPKLARILNVHPLDLVNVIARDIQRVAK